MVFKQSTTNVSFPCALLPTWNSKQVIQWEAKGIYFWKWAPEPLRLLSHASFQLNEALKRLRLVTHLLPRWTISDHPMRSPETSPWRFKSISRPLIHTDYSHILKASCSKIFMYFMVYSMISQPRHYGHLWLDKSMWWEPVPCPVGCFTASLASTY